MSESGKTAVRAGAAVGLFALISALAYPYMTSFRHEATLIKHGQQLEDTEETLEEHKVKIEDHGAALERHETQLQRHEKTLVDHSASLESQERVLEQTGEQLTKAETKLEGQEKTIEGLGKELGDLKQAVSSGKAEAKQLRERTEALGKRVEALEQERAKERAAYQEALEQILKRVETLEKNAPSPE